MKRLALLAAAAVFAFPRAAPAADDARAVTPETFPRAETDLRFGRVVKEAGLGKFRHERQPVALDKQRAVKMDRDTLYSDAVFDLNAGPVTITLPDAGRRCMSLQIIDRDGYTPEVDYAQGPHTLSAASVGTRYALAAVRIFVDPNDPKDVEAVNALQDAIKVEQPGGPGAFEPGNWDAFPQTAIRTALLALAETLPDAKGMSGARGKVDPVRRLIGSASAWGSLPMDDAVFVEATPERDDGRTIYRLEFKDPPVDGFWSVAVYNDRGFLEPNPQKANSITSVNAKAGPDGTVAVQFGGCEATIPNCLPTPPGWSYMIRLYRPKAAVASGAWSFPEPKLIGPAPEAAAPPSAAPAPAAQARPASPPPARKPAPKAASARKRK